MAAAVLVSLGQRRMSSVPHARASVHCIGVARRVVEGHDTLGWPLQVGDDEANKQVKFAGAPTA